MGFDTTTVPAQLAALVARCDYQQFALTKTPTNLLNAGHPSQAEFPVVPGSNVALGWTGVYRGRTFNGSQQPPLVIASKNILAGQAAVLTAASAFLDGVDLQFASGGGNPNPYNPTTGGGQAG
jgi:hypothetical protein